MTKLDQLVFQAEEILNRDDGQMSVEDAAYSAAKAASRRGEILPGNISLAVRAIVARITATDAAEAPASPPALVVAETVVAATAPETARQKLARLRAEALATLGPRRTEMVWDSTSRENAGWGDYRKQVIFDPAREAAEKAALAAIPAALYEAAEAEEKAEQAERSRLGAIEAERLAKEAAERLAKNPAREALRRYAETKAGRLEMDSLVCERHKAWWNANRPSNWTWTGPGAARLAALKEALS